MKHATITIMVIAFALVAVVAGQASAATVASDSGGTAWRDSLYPYSYQALRPSPTSCSLAYYTWTPPPPHGDSIAVGYRIYNLYGISKPAVCTLRFSATEVAGMVANCQIWIGSPGTSLSRDSIVRWQALSTGPALASPTLNANTSKYACAINPNYLSFGSNFVFIAFGSNSKNNTEWRIANDTLVYYY